MKPLPRIRELATFQERYFMQHHVVVERAAQTMTASSWSAAFLVEALGSQRPTVRLPNGKLAHMRMTDFMRYFTSPDSFASSQGPIYLTDFYLSPSFGDAEREALGKSVACPLVAPEQWDAWQRQHTGWNTLYVGAAGTSTWLHQDPFSTSSWLAAISGVKHWRLCRPDGLSSAAARATDPFTEERLPCEFFEAELRAGDVMYVPPDWWHAVRNETATIAVTGNVCTVERARASFAEAQAMPPSSKRDVWTRTWAAILGLGPEAESRA